MSDALCENWEEFSEDAEKLEKQLEKLKMVPDTSKVKVEHSRLDPLAASFQPSTDVPAAPNSAPQFRILRRSQDPATVGIPANANFNSPGIQLDSTTEESLRTQFVPQLKILARPKNSPTPNAAASSSRKEKKQVTTTKTFAQREKEYSEARMRILGDVRFLEEEKEAELEATMTPAEILKMKVTRAVMGDGAASSPISIPTASTNDIKRDPDPLLSQSPTIGQSGDGGSIDTGMSKTKNKRKSRSRPSSSPIVSPPVHFPPSKLDAERILRQPRGPDGTSGFHSPR